ncbi:hypothetical protein [Microcystis aeruginosa]|uniref:hypothetical protein n=1 Tax=Microcystis aeruginosa TaxID=1126 RepID=UPI0012DA2858|nr:hypothetical protein [Microcystis aeruginosa]
MDKAFRLYTPHPTPHTPHPAPTKNFFSRPYLGVSRQTGPPLLFATVKFVIFLVEFLHQINFF